MICIGVFLHIKLFFKSLPTCITRKKALSRFLTSWQTYQRLLSSFILTLCVLRVNILTLLENLIFSTVYMIVFHIWLFHFRDYILTVSIQKRGTTFSRRKQDRNTRNVTNQVITKAIISDFFSVHNYILYSFSHM